MAIVESPAKPRVDRLIGRGLIFAEAVAQELRDRLASELSQRRTDSVAELLTIAREVLREYDPVLAGALFDTEIAAWISGVDFVAGSLPDSVLDSIGSFNGGGQLPPSVPSFGGGDFDDEEPTVRFPLIERAAARLADRNVVTREQFDQLAAEARNQAFTVTAEVSEATIERLRDALAETVAEGPSLRQFRERVADVLEASAIGPAHLETIYRNAVQTAFHQGHDELADNPIVSEIFPYQEYLPIHDGRVDPQHLALGSLGLSGTGVYRRDDPFWDLFTPPWRHRCRCGINLLTVEAAARKGVHEARDWLRTGQPPILPEWRLSRIPFRPAPGWGRRALVA